MACRSTGKCSAITSANFRRGCSLVITEFQYSTTCKSQNYTEKTFHSNPTFSLTQASLGEKNRQNHFMFLSTKEALFFPPIKLENYSLDYRVCKDSACIQINMRMCIPELL